MQKKSILSIFKAMNKFSGRYQLVLITFSFCYEQMSQYRTSELNSVMIALTEFLNTFHTTLEIDFI